MAKKKTANQKEAEMQLEAKLQALKRQELVKK